MPVASGGVAAATHPTVGDGEAAAPSTHLTLLESFGLACDGQRVQVPMIRFTTSAPAGSFVA